LASSNNNELFQGHTCGHRHALYFQEQAGQARAKFRPFPLPGDKPHYAPNREYALEHIFLDISLDFQAKTVTGIVHTTLRPVNDGLTSITFDSDDTVVERITIEGEDKPLEFSHAGERLKINLATARNADEELTLAIEYTATPRRGLYFVVPDEAYPNKNLQAWSQGQDTDNHSWFPCFDAPNQKATSELRVTVPESFFALSNGGLLETYHNTTAKTKTYHWKQAIAHSTYLITLAAGEFVEILDHWEDIPVPYYVFPGQEEKARIALGKTPEMLKFFSEKIGVRYPYEKYATVVVGDFIFGGMENTTATTLTDTTLHDARAHQDFTSDPLVSHELAHQWFGDWLTCRDWSNGWLNEGFATYFEALWTEFDLGRDEFIYEMYQNAQTYISEDSGHYRRPIVAYTFNQPIDLFDRHLYEKGSLVLNMIRFQLGDDLWWKAINHYVNKHKGQNVITADLERAIEEATGLNLQPFFEQWLYKAGYPQFKISWSWDDKSQTAKFTLAQTQEINNDTLLFTLPVEIAFVGDSGKRETFRVELEEKEQNFYFRLTEKPVFASFDPANWLLKSVEWSRPKEQLIAQLQKDTEAFGRFTAAQALGKLGSLEAVEALEKALRTDAFWVVRAESARSLGAIKSPAAEKALLGALSEEQNARVRRAIVGSLGEFRSEAVAASLTKVLAGDITDIIEGAAATALGKTRQPEAFDILKKALERDSFNQVVRNGAFSGLVALKNTEAIPLTIEWTAYGKPDLARLGATAALGNLGKLVKDKEKEQVVDRLLELLDDTQWRERLAAIRAVQTLGETKPIAKLQRIAETSIEGREIRVSREAIMSLREGAAKDEEVKKLREDLDKLQTENRDLRERLETIEQKLK